MIPSYLYHYTSLETLLLILEHNTFRFNRLDRMNDPFEGYSSLFLDSRQCVFATSWTSEERDELPMWKIYSNLSGIRLRMPIDLFDHIGNFKVVKMERANNFLIKSDLNKSYKIERQPLPYEVKKSSDKDFVSNCVYGPSKVGYFETKESLEKGVVLKKQDVGFDFYEINLNLIGQKKLDYWSFEKEYRYRIFFGNSIMLAGSDKVLNEFLTNSPVMTEFVDVQYKPGSLENIEIVLGPNADIEAKEKIEKLLNKEGVKNYEILKSKIQIR